MGLDEDNTGTSFFVRDFKRRRWMLRLRLIGGLALGVAITGYLLSNFRDSGWARLTKDDAAPPPNAGSAPAEADALKAEEGVAVIEVHMSVPGQLWVDSQAVGRDVLQTLRLPPGQHKIAAQQQDGMLVQNLETLAGEVYRVEFGTAAATKRILPR